MFDYDAWLESPYTDSEFICESDDCSTCNELCSNCDATGLDGSEKCSTCDGSGSIREEKGKAEHDQDNEPERDDQDE
jgi:DnaJ-class molecular chaperone